MTLTRSILSRSSGCRDLEVGDFLEVGGDVIYLHEALGKVLAGFEELETMGMGIRDPENVIIVFDHWLPAPDVRSASNHKRVRDFVRRIGLEHFYDVGRGGICHHLIAEKGFVIPRNIVFGSDSHTPTLGALGALAIGLGPTDMLGLLVKGTTWLEVPASIGIRVDGDFPENVLAKDLALRVLKDLGTDGAEGKVLEYKGGAIANMGMNDRFSVANMSTESGALSCIIPPDGTVVRFLHGSRARQFSLNSEDPRGPYDTELEIDVGNMEPLVACPDDPLDIRTVRDLEGTPLDQIYIGSCSNGRPEDLRMVAKTWKGKRVSNNCRVIVSPATQRVHIEVMEDGTVETLMKAGAIVTSPGCNACFGGHQGILGPNEICLSTTNRSFQGRMGSVEAKLYLASPATAAASALKGMIVDPRDT